MTTDPHVRPFAEFLTHQRRGRLHNELSDALAELNARVVEHGKGGSITLTVSIAPASRHGDNVVTVTDKVTVKLPQPERGTAIWWVDDNGGLSRNDPNQQTLPLRAVDGGADDEDHAEEATQ